MVLGLLLMLSLRRQGQQNPWSREPGDPSRADVAEAYARAMAQLRELQEDPGRMDEAYVRAERGRVEARAAALLGQLRALGQRPDRPAAPPARPSGRPQAWVPRFLQRHPKLVGGLWGAGLTALGLFLVTTVRQGSTPRPAPPVAAAAEASAGGPQMDRQRFVALQEQLKQSPDDVPALLELAHMLLRAQMLEEAQVLNDRALTLDGHNLEGLTHAAVLAASRGEHAGAQAGLKAVLTQDPGFAEAWFFRGMLSMQQGDMPAMQESLRQFVRYAPDGAQKERVRAMLERAEAKP
jgi:tetratricopeptide (TPR) repeat protein